MSLRWSSDENEPQAEPEEVCFCCGGPEPCECEIDSAWTTATRT